MAFLRSVSDGKNSKPQEKSGKRLNTEVEQTFVISAGENAVRTRLVAHFRDRRYSLMGSAGDDSLLRFERPASVFDMGVHADPGTAMSAATVELVSRATGTEVRCHLRLRSVAGFPWERWYWMAELRSLRKSLGSGFTAPAPSTWGRLGVNVLNISVLALSAGVLAALIGWVTFAAIQRVTGWTSNAVGWVGLPIILALLIVTAADLQHLLESKSFKWRVVDGLVKDGGKRMRLALLVVAGVIIAGVVGFMRTYTPGRWQEVTSQEGGFSVLMPGTPTQTTEVRDTALGPINEYAYTVHERGYAWRVAYGDLGRNLNENDLAERIFDYVRGPLITYTKSKLVSETSVSLDGYPGRHIELKPTAVEGVIIVRVFIVGSRMYMMAVGGQGKKDISAEAEKFFDSFQLLKK